MSSNHQIHYELIRSLIWHAAVVCHPGSTYDSVRLAGNIPIAISITPRVYGFTILSRTNITISLFPTWIVQKTLTQTLKSEQLIARSSELWPNKLQIYHWVRQTAWLLERAAGAREVLASQAGQPWRFQRRSRQKRAIFHNKEHIFR